MITFKQFLLTEREKDQARIKLGLKVFNKIEKMVLNGEMLKYFDLYFVTSSKEGDKSSIGVGFTLGDIFPKLFDNEKVIFSKIDAGDAYFDVEKEQIVISFFDFVEGLPNEDEIDEKSKKITIKILYNILKTYWNKRIDNTAFLHELTHLLDYKYHNVEFNYSNRGMVFDEDYYNSPEEVNAYFLSNLHFLRNLAKKLNNFEEFYKRFVEEMDDVYPDVYKFLNDTNKKKVIKRLYDFWGRTKGES